VTSDPYVAVSDTDGSFEIKNLPVGECQLRFWHEKFNYMKLRPSKGNDKVGKAIKFNIESGDNDLGEFFFE
jgi:hypothetical protein